MRQLLLKLLPVLLAGLAGQAPVRGDMLLNVGSGSSISLASGGGVAAFSPSDVAGLRLWLKGDAGVTSTTLTSAKFVRANNEYLSVASNATLQTGDIDFTIAFRFKYKTRVASDFVAKLGTSGQWEYLIRDDGTGLSFNVSSNGSNLTVAKDATTALSPLGIWHTVICWHDSVANTLNVQIDGNTVASTGYSSGVRAGTSDVRIGNSEFSGNPIDAQIDSVGFWKRTLTSSERTFLHNSNSGQSYSTIGVAATNGSDLKTSLISWWDMTETSGTRFDAHGSNNLTDNNTVDGVSENEVSLWADQSGNGYDFTQSTGSRPIQVTSAINSLPVIQTDGVTQFIQNDSMLGIPNLQGRTMIVVAKIATAATRTPILLQGISGSSSDYFGLDMNTSLTAGSRFGLFATQSALDTNATTDTSYHVFYVAASTMSGGSISSNTVYRVDKATKTLSTNIGSGNFVSLSGGNATAIGRFPGSSPFGACSIAEVLFYDVVPSTTNRANLEDYLTTKYAL